MNSSVSIAIYGRITFLSTVEALNTLAEASDQILVQSGLSFTMTSCLHERHGDCAVLLSTVGPNMLFTAR